MSLYSDILLTVDFDRTLTAPDSTIPERNLRAIEYFMENGGSFTVNTGRSLPMYSRLLNQVPVNVPLLLYNGSAAYDLCKKQFTFTHEIDLDWKDVLRRVMDQFPDHPVELQGMRHHYLFVDHPMWERYNNHNGCPWAYGSFDGMDEPFLKFTIYGQIRENTVAHLYEGSLEELERIEQIMAVLRQELGEHCAIFRAAPRIIDVHARGVSKAEAARRLQRELGKKILVCVGDGENDISMLQEADYAFCPGDAMIRDRFENVCRCAEGAVADVIYEKIPEIIG